MQNVSWPSTNVANKQCELSHWFSIVQAAGLNHHRHASQSLIELLMGSNTVRNAVFHITDKSTGTINDTRLWLFCFYLHNVLFSTKGKEKTI